MENVKIFEYKNKTEIVPLRYSTRIKTPSAIVIASSVTIQTGEQRVTINDELMEVIFEEWNKKKIKNKNKIDN